MRPLADLIHAHAGRPAFVMGGGDSLPKDLERAPRDCVYISANQHGCFLRTCDYIVAIDSWFKKDFKTPQGTTMRMRDFGVPVISVRREDADIRMFEKPTSNSGVSAAWVAWVMGCAPILIGGMDCYTGGTYFHDPKAQSSGRSVHLTQHLGRWAKLPQVAPDGMFRVMSGPLVGLFPAYDPAEAVRSPARPSAIKGTRGTVVRLNKRILLGHAQVGPGEYELSDGELRRAYLEKAIEKPQRAAA